MEEQKSLWWGSLAEVLFVSLSVIAVASGCREQVKDPSADCRTIEFPSGEMERSLNIVFVPSGYNGDMEKFARDARWTISRMHEYPAMAEGFNKRNIFYVTKESGRNQFCEIGCGGVARRVCCDRSTAKELSMECGAPVRQTIVLVNDSRYGGSASLSDDIAYLTLSHDAPDVFVHELAHSFFKLSDEYDYGHGNALSRNCDIAGCSKWSDLIEAGVQDVGCYSGYCAGGNYFASNHTNMTQLRQPFYSANERIACCEYKNVTGEYPAFCSRFQDTGVGLNRFCDRYFAADQIYVAKPVILELSQSGTQGSWKLVSQQQLKMGRYFSKRLVIGEQKGGLSVELKSGSGQSRTFQFESEENLEIFNEDGTIARSPGRVLRNTVSVVIDRALYPETKGVSLNVNRIEVHKW